MYLDQYEMFVTLIGIIIFLLVVIVILQVTIVNHLRSSGLSSSEQEKSKIDEQGYTNEERESLKSKTKPETKVEVSTKFEGELEEKKINRAIVFITICFIILFTIGTLIVYNIRD
tara:strand:+ start:229 stop:573 length:345 start_codon:yes stop_codon:yes gene_type:complete